MKKVLEVIPNLKQEVTRRGTTLKSKSSVTCTIYEACLKSNETGATNFFIYNWTTNQHYPLGKPHTAGDVAPTSGSSAGILHVEVPSDCLSRPFGCCPQFHLWGEIWVSERKKSHGLDQASVGLLKFWNTFFGQKLFHGDGSTIGSFVVMEHPIVRNLCPDTLNPFSESFKERTVVLFNNCLSLRHDFLMNNTLVVEKKNSMDLIFDLVSSGAISCSCATSNFVVWFRDGTRKSMTHHLLCLKKFRHFRCFQEGPGTHSFSFPFVRWWGFLEPALHKFRAWPVPRPKCRKRFRDSNPTHCRLFCQTSIRPHKSPHVGHIFALLEVQGLPELGSSSTLSRPFKNVLCHLKPASPIQHALHKPLFNFL